MSDPRSRIPGVDRLLVTPEAEELLATHPRSRVVEALRATVAIARESIGAGQWEGDAGDPGPYLRRARSWLLADARPSLRPVLNATGVVLHTNLGRAPLAPGAIEAVRTVSRGYSNLEFDLDRGARGSRYEHSARLLEELTGAEAALVVNNCAAALVLAVAASARGKDVLVSRGELVEIGGGFRIPDILRQGGARLREVGATNRTRLADYREALRSGGVGAVLKVHRSNFRISGFTEEAGLEELSELVRDQGVPLLYDLGSGLLVEPERLGLPTEPRPRDGVAAGADLVMFSGDKLLGGPQSGLVAGRAEAVHQLRRHPLCRAFRVDKGTLAALEATLRLHRDPEEAVRRIPVLRYLAAGRDEIRARCEALAGELGPRVSDVAEVGTGERSGRVGGGTYPEHDLPSWGVSVRPRYGNLEAFTRILGEGEPPVVGRVEEGVWWIDPRAVDPSFEETLLAGVEAALRRLVKLGPGR